MPERESALIQPSQEEQSPQEGKEWTMRDAISSFCRGLEKYSNWPPQEIERLQQLLEQKLKDKLNNPPTNAGMSTLVETVLSFARMK